MIVYVVYKHCLINQIKSNLRAAIDTTDKMWIRWCYDHKKLDIL